MSNDDILTEYFLYGDRYTIGADVDRQRNANDLISLDRAKATTDKQRAKRLRDLARAYPFMSEGALIGLATTGGLLSVDNTAPVAAADATSLALQGKFGATGRDMQPQGPKAVNGDPRLRGLHQYEEQQQAQPDLPPETVNPQPPNPRGADFEQSVEQHGIIPQIEQGVHATVGTPVAALASLLTPIADVLWRRPGGVRKEVDWYASQFGMDEATKYAFAQEIGKQDQMGAIPWLPGPAGAIPRHLLVEPFIGDDPRNPENADEMRQAYEAGNYDKETVAKAVAQFNDPEMGYQGNSQGGLLARNWYASPFGQLVTFGGWGESWIGMPQENIERIEKFHASEYDIRSPEERRTDAAKYREVLLEAQRNNVLDSLDPAKLDAAFGPRAGTLGRYVAEYEAGFDPNTMPYRLLSGGIDILATAGLDPASYIPGAKVSNLTKLGLNATHRGALALPSVGRFVPAVRSAEGTKSAVFETARIIRNANKAKGGYVVQSADNLTDAAAPQPTVEWRSEAGVEFPYDPNGDQKYAHGVRGVDKWESNVGGVPHALVKDPETDKWGYVGPLDITDQYDSVRELQQEVISRYLPEFDDVTPGDMPIPENVVIDQHGDAVGMVPTERLWSMHNGVEQQHRVDLIQQSVTDEGVLVPIVVNYNPDTGMSFIRSGFARLQAARNAGVRNVPVVVKVSTDESLYNVERLARRYNDLPEEALFGKGMVNPRYFQFGDEVVPQPGQVGVTSRGEVRLPAGESHYNPRTDPAQRLVRGGQPGVYVGQLWDGTYVQVRQTRKVHGKRKWAIFRDDAGNPGEQIGDEFSSMKEARDWINSDSHRQVNQARINASLMERPVPRTEIAFPGGKIVEQDDGTWLKQLDSDVEDLIPWSFKSSTGSEYLYSAATNKWRRYRGVSRMVHDPNGGFNVEGGWADPFDNTGWVTGDEADWLQVAADRGVIRQEGDSLIGVRHTKGPDWNQEVFNSEQRAGRTFDEAYRAAGGKIEEVRVSPSRSPQEGLFTFEWMDDFSKTHSGSDISDVQMKSVPRESVYESGDEAITSVTDDFVSDNAFHRNAEYTVVDREHGNHVRSFSDRGQARDYALRESGYSPESPESYLTLRQTDNFLRYTKPGQMLVQALIDLKSPSEIIRRSGRKIDVETAALLADAKTRDDVYSILGQRIGTTITNDSTLTRFMGLRSSWTDRMYRAESNRGAMRAVMRLGRLAPRDNAMRMDDPDEVVEQMMRWGFGMKHQWHSTEDVVGIRDYIDGYIRLRHSLGDRYKLFNAKDVGFWDYVVRQAMTDAGVPAKKSRRLSRAFRDRADDESKAYKGSVLPEDRIRRPDQDIEMFGDDTDLNMIKDGSIGDGTWVMGESTDLPLFMDEAMRTYMPVPAYRSIRRQVNLVSKTLRRLPAGESLQTVYDIVGEWAQYMTRWWRNFTLANVAYFVRNVGEEHFRAGLSGDVSIFTNPIQALSTSITIAASREASNRTSKAMQTMMMLGLPNMIRRAQRGLENPESIHMVNLSVFDGMYAKPGLDVPASSPTGRSISQGKLRRSLARSGPQEPVVVAYDPARQVWRVKDGHKRLSAWEDFPDGRRPEVVPVRIVEERIPEGSGNDVPKKATTKVVPTPRRRKPTLLVDDTLRKANPDHLFGKGTSKGVLADLIAQGKEDVNQMTGLNAALSYAFPLFRHRYAYLNGDEWNKAHNAALDGNWEDVHDRMTRMSTLAAGGYLQDDAAARIRSKGIVTVERDTEDRRKEYLRMLAIRHKQLSDLPHVKNMLGRWSLEPDLNVYIDDMIARQPEEMKKLQALLSGSERYSSLQEMVQSGLDNLDSFEYSTVRNILGAQLETAWLMSGKGNVDVAEAMHTGVYKGRKIGPDNPEYMKLLSSLMDDPNQRTMFPERLSGKPSSAWEDNPQEWLASRPAKLVEWFFNTAGENRDLLTASPLMRARYAEAAEQLVPHMTLQARRQVVHNLRKAGDKKLADRVERAASAHGDAPGWLDVDAAHMIASNRASDAMRTLFYDAAERRNWAMAMRVIAPFAQAQVNTLAVWGKLMLDRPVDYYRTMRPITAFRNEWSMTSYDLLSQLYGSPDDEMGIEPQYEPFLHYTEGGDDRYAMPAFGALAKLLGVEATASGTMSSLNLAAGGVIPGVGPVLSVPASFWADGALQSPTFEGDIARALWKYPLPKGSPADKIMGGLLPGKWQDGMMSAGDPTNPEFVKKQMAMLQQIMATGRKSNGQPFDPTVEADMQEAQLQAAVKARQLLYLETLVKVFLPAGGPLTFDPDTAIQSGDSDTVMFVANRELAQVWRSYTGNVKGEDYGKRVMEFNKDFGTFVQFPFAPVTDNSEAPPLTFEMQQIQNDLPETYARYNDLWRWVMPKGDPYGSLFGDQQLAQFREEQTDRGYRKSLTFAEVAKIQYQYMIGGVMMQRLDEAERLFPGDGAMKQRIRAEAYASGYEQELLLDSAANAAQQVTQMLEDEVARDAVPGGEYIYSYLQERQRQIEQLQGGYWSGERNSGVLDTQHALYAAMALENIARKYQSADTSGSFTRFWETVGRVELGENADLIEEMR